MFAVIQFPIADARGFAVDPDPRLDVPRFDKPITVGGSEFLRCFGKPVDRRREPDPELLDEKAFFRARGALQFVDLQDQQLPASHTVGAPQSVFRRFFSSGEAVIRIELGFRLTTFTVRPSTPEELVATAHGVMCLPTRVPTYAEPKVGSSGKLLVNKKTPVKALILQGDWLARLFTVATSAQLTTRSIDAQRKLVAAGRPITIIEYAKSEVAQLPVDVELVDPAQIDGATLGFARIWIGSGFVGAWFLCRDGVDADQLRKLRLCLLRLNAEREVLDRIIYWVDKGRIPVEPGTAQLEQLEAYFNQSTRFIQRSTSYGLSQSAIGAAFDASEQAEIGVNRTALLADYDGVRKMIWRKVELYQQSRGTTTQVGGLQVNLSGGQLQLTYVNEIKNSQIGAIGSGSQGDVIGTVASTGAEDNRVAPPGNPTEATMNEEAGKPKEPTGDSTTVGNIQNSQVGAIGTNAQGTVSGTLILNAAAVSQINGIELKNALNDLYSALGQDVPNVDVARKTQADANAAIETIKDGKIEDAEGMAGKVKAIGDTLKETNTTVEQGSKLWKSIKKVAETIGPLVGDAFTVAKWFAIIL